MKKKTKTYILLLVVALIWGVIIYKLLAGFSGNNVTEQIQLPVITVDTTQREVFDTIPLSLNYRDPFLKNRYTVRKAKVTSQTRVVKKRVEKKIVKRVYWPQVQFDGLIVSKESKLAMLRINKKSYIVAQGALEQNVTVVKAFQDSILLSYKYEEKYFYKK